MEGIKEFFTYLTNQLKFWFIVKEWENGLQLRNGKIIRELKHGLYFKIPFLDFIYCQPKRTKEVVVSQVNFTTRDNKQITCSASAFFRITSIKEYYNGFAEPLSIIDSYIKNLLNRYFLKTNIDDFNIDDLELFVLSELKKIKEKGIEFKYVKLITFSNAKTYRIITDKLYSQIDSELDKQVF